MSKESTDIDFVDTDKKVLLVEDNPGDVVLFKKHLASIPDLPRVPLVHVNSVSAAVRELKREKFGVIFLDLNLPDDIGVSSVRTVRSHAGDADIIVLTSMAGQATYDEAAKAGALVVLLKHELSPAVIEAYLPA